MSDAGEIIRSGAFDKLADIAQKLAGPMAEELGLLMADKIKVHRLRNWISVVNKTEHRALSTSPGCDGLGELGGAGLGAGMLGQHDAGETLPPNVLDDVHERDDTPSAASASSGVDSAA